MFDPSESRNLVGGETSQPVLAEMRERLKRWMRETGDPLLEGPIEPPSGVEINDPDGLSAQEPPTLVP